MPARSPSSATVITQIEQVTETTAAAEQLSAQSEMMRTVVDQLSLLVHGG